MNLNEFLTGIVNSSVGPVIFICEGCKFRFLTTNTNRIGRDKNVSLIPDEYGYLHGQTHDGRAIHISTKNVLQIHSKRTFHVSHYFISFKNLQGSVLHSFRGLRVENGSLRSVFRPKSSLMERIESGINEETCNDILSSSFKFSQTKATIRIGTRIVEERSQNEGDRIIRNVMLDLLFESSLLISEFSDAFSCILSLCRFMTGRQNIGFEKISLLIESENSDVSFPTAYICCHMDNSELYTTRPLHECIQFSDIADDVGKLAEFFYLHKKDSAFLGMEFLPPDDSMIHVMSNSIVRNIVISFENAAKLDGLNACDNQLTDKLTEYLETAMNNHMNSSEGLPDHTIYTKMKNRLKDRNRSLPEQIKVANHKFIRLMEFVVVPTEYKLNQKSIKALVNYRHDSMHGRIGNRDDLVCFAAYQVVALIYCCILDAAKISNNVIEKVMQKGVYRP